MMKVDRTFFQLFVEPGGVVKEKFAGKDRAAVAVEEAHIGQRVLVGEQFLNAHQYADELSLLFPIQLAGSGLVDFARQSAEVGKFGVVFPAEESKAGLDFWQAKVASGPPKRGKVNGIAEGILWPTEAILCLNIDAVSLGEMLLDRLKFRVINDGVGCPVRYRADGLASLGELAKIRIDPPQGMHYNSFVGRAIRAEFVEQVGKVSRHDRDRRSNDLRYDFANRWRNALPLVGA
jgi:hypothetical protein